MSDAPYNIAILGASGYTGAELVRLISTHPRLEIAALTADRKAGKTMAEVFPHLGHLDLPVLKRIEDVELSALNLVFCALPHGSTQALVSDLPEAVKVVDLSADFRLRDPAEYKKWYGLDHTAAALQKTAVYGLPEFYRDEIKSARLVANTGCYVATTLLAVLPLLQAGVIDPDEIVVDAKSGVSGAGRAAKEAMLFTEVSEGFSAYGVGGHRHMGELDQEMSRAAGRPVVCAFTPHLIPINRAIFATIYVNGEADAIHQALTAKYSDEPFIHVRAFGSVPRSHEVRGSNLCHIGVVPDRRDGRSVVISTLDNLMKGASGQALQNANLMLGLPETMGLDAAPLFP